MQHAGAGSRAISSRRLLLFGLAVAALLAVHASGLTLTVQGRSVEPNGTVTVPIAVADAADLGEIAMDLVYDPAVLRFVSATPGSLADRAQVNGAEVAPGRVAVTVASPRSLTGSGPLAVLTFVATGPQGARSPVALEDVRAVTVDGDTEPAGVVNGTVSVGGGIGTPLSPFTAAGALVLVAVPLGLARRFRPRR